MKRRIGAFVAMPALVSLIVAGCCSQPQKTASFGPAYAEGQGAPAVEPKTEVMAATGGVETSTQADIELRKEELVVGKREVSNGGVLVRTVVQTENVSQPVELQREEYVIERVPASQVPAEEASKYATGKSFQQREIYIPLTREDPVASKRTFIAEKVQIGKRIETDKQTVSHPVRSEDVEVTKITGKAAGSYWQESAPVATSAPSEPNSLHLMREQMTVGKTVVDNGGVKLRKIVRTQDASAGVELKREEYTLNRSPLADQPSVHADFAPKEMRLNLTREEAVAGVREFPTEWVRVRKQIQTDKPTITGTVRTENIEIVKLTAEQAAMGGTGTAGQSGTSTLSEAGHVSITGKGLCAKCQLHETATCQNVIQVTSGDKTLNYYVVQNDVSKNFHENLCKEVKQVTATGTVREAGGKLELLPSKLALAK